MHTLLLLLFLSDSEGFLPVEHTEIARWHNKLKQLNADSYLQALLLTPISNDEYRDLLIAQDVDKNDINLTNFQTDILACSPEENNVLTEVNGFAS